MSSETYRASDHKEWEAAGLEVPGECMEYVNQQPDYGDSLSGDWYAADDEKWTIYSGSFGNDHSPGASHYTYAEVYDNLKEYLVALAEWEALPEYLDSDESSEDDESDEPSECDYTTEDYVHWYEAGTGKLLLVTPSEMTTEEMVAALRRHMEANNWFPAVWCVSDHGNWTQVDMGGEAAQGGKP